MISLCDGLPDTIKVDGEDYKINTDFRVWLRAQTEGFDVVALFPSQIPPLTEDTERAISQFANGGIPFQLQNQEGEPDREESQEDRLLDFEIDGGLIYAAFMQAYNIDLMAIEHLHWHAFLALLFGLPDNTKLSTIISIRQYDGDDEGMKRLKSEWELPVQYSEEELAAAERFEALFGRG